MAADETTRDKARRGAASQRRGRRFPAILIAAALLCLWGVPTALAADSVFWVNRLGIAISSANLDGTGGGDLATGAATVSGPFGTALDSASGRIYWPNFEANKISFANLDGTGGGDLATGAATVNEPVGVAVDPAAGRIYWADTGANKISFAKLDGTGGGDLATGAATVNEPFGVAVNPAAGRIYWANAAGNKISFAKLDGSGGGDLLTGSATVNEPTGVAVDPAAGRIYWANDLADKISFAKLDGTGGGDLATTGATVVGPQGIALDPAAGRVYWGNAGGNRISFAELDGTGGGDLNTPGAETNWSVFPALLKSPSATGAPVINGGTSVGSSLGCSTGSWAPDAVPEFLYRAPQGFAYQWSLDGADIAGATQSSITADVPGEYRCRVTAENHAGSASQTSAAQSVAVSVSSLPPPLNPPPPNTKLAQARIDPKAGKATFKFKATGNSTGFQCALVAIHRKPKFRRCASPKTYKHLKPGSFTFKVRAVGPGGPDSTPAKKKFKIKR